MVYLWQLQTLSRIHTAKFYLSGFHASKFWLNAWAIFYSLLHRRLVLSGHPLNLLIFAGWWQASKASIFFATKRFIDSWNLAPVSAVTSLMPRINDRAAGILRLATCRTVTKKRTIRKIPSVTPSLHEL